MAELNEAKVRELAYQLWENDGRQSGKEADYWHAAEELLADEGEGQVSSEPTTVVPLLPLSTPLK